jgi:hypothetical protein
MAESHFLWPENANGVRFLISQILTFKKVKNLFCFSPGPVLWDPEKPGDDFRTGSG